MKKSLLFMICGALILGGCATDSDAPYNEKDFAQGGTDAPLYNERTSTFMQSDNQYSNIDSYKPKTAEEKEKSNIIIPLVILIFSIIILIFTIIFVRKRKGNKKELPLN